VRTPATLLAHHAGKENRQGYGPGTPIDPDRFPMTDLEVHRYKRQGCIVLSFRGDLHASNAPEASRAVAKALAESPRAVVCDVSRLTVHGEATAVFLVLADLAADWPDAPVVLCGAGAALTGRLRLYRIDERLVLRPSVQAALTDPGQQPDLLQATLWLRSTPDAPRLARGFLASVCERWSATRFLDAGSLALSELVTNVVRHVGTPLKIRVVLTAHHLRLSVRDRGPGWPHTVAAGQRPVGGLGLRMVAALSTGWGVIPVEAGGKVVWCRLDESAATPEQAPRPAPVEGAAF